MSPLFRRVLCASVVGIVTMLTPAYSGNVYYDDAGQSTFNSLTGDMSVIDFNGQVAPGNYKQSTTSDGYPVNPETGNTSLQVRFVGVIGTSSYLTNINNFPGGIKDWNTGAVLQGPGSGYGNSSYRLHIELPTAVTAVALNLMTWNYSSWGDGSGDNVAVSINGSPAATVSTKAWTYSAANPTPGSMYATPTWFGITSDTPINYLDLSSATGTLLIDNFNFGTLLSGGTEPPPPPDTGGDTPEASTLMMIGTGLLSLRYWKKRSGASPA